MKVAAQANGMAIAELVFDRAASVPDLPNGHNLVPVEGLIYGAAYESP
jgi:hypothetical protein